MLGDTPDGCPQPSTPRSTTWSRRRLAERRLASSERTEWRRCLQTNWKRHTKGFGWKGKLQQIQAHPCLLQKPSGSLLLRKYWMSCIQQHPKTKDAFITTWTELSFWGAITEGRLFRSHLRPNQWSDRVPIGTKWKIWTWSFYGYPLVYCRSTDIDITASQSQAFFRNSQKCWKLTIFDQLWKSIFGSLFFKKLPFKIQWRFLNEPKGRWSLEH